MKEYNYEDIEQTYSYDGKDYKTSVRFFPDKNIATIVKTEFSGEDTIEVGIVEEGMTRDEIEYYFPPMEVHQKMGHTYSLAKIIRSVIYEAFTKEGGNIEEGNVRNFWYTHLKKLITEILGLGETDTVLSAINEAWAQVINSGLVNYEEMNILGGKEDSRLSIVRDSPFNNLIIAVEKVDYFHMYQWIPRLFNSTLITAGGQPSRTVARAFIRELGVLGVDLDQDFYMCTISDLDPAGYYIQEAFRKQFESAIEYYGGSGRILIRRLFVREDQVTPELLRSQAIPCQDMARTTKARRAEDTKWNFFCEMTRGGIYIPKLPSWTGPYYEKDGRPVVRALLEMNAFSKEVIEKSIIRELLKIIDETNDESKIMIPEIMRVFSEMRGEVSKEKFEEWKEKLIKPLIDRFLSDTKEYNDEIYSKYYEERDDIKERYQEEIDEQFRSAREQEPDLWKSKDNLEAQIQTLEEQLSDVDDEIHEKCEEQYNKIDDLESERDDEINEKSEQRDYRLKKLSEFKDEKSTVFNPLEQELKRKINEFIFYDSSLQFFFKDIETLNQFKPHIARLLTQPDLLLDQNISCFEQPVFTFLEQDLLQKASRMKDENVGNVRNAFPRVFTQEMKQFINELIGSKEFIIEGEQVEQVDLTDEINELKDRIEQSIEDGTWTEESDEE